MVDQPRPADVAALRRQLEDAKNEGFDKFMADPMTRMVISLIPGGAPGEALALLLQAAYTSGFVNGEATLGVAMLEKISRKWGEPR